VMHPCRFRFK